MVMLSLRSALKISSGSSVEASSMVEGEQRTGYEGERMVSPCGRQRPVCPSLQMGFFEVKYFTEYPAGIHVVQSN